MPCRCSDVGLDEIFDEDFARGDADKYRRRGLPARARLLLELIGKNIDLSGIRSLEGGAGAGALTVEIARQGAARAHGIDATAVAVEHARKLAAEFAVGDRATFALGDFASIDPAQEPADLVVLDRVVCCYPDWESLIGNAAAAARRVVALSFPADRLWSPAVIRTMNVWQALRRRHFRLHYHPPKAMLRTLAVKGFTQVTRRRYWFWELVVVCRPR